MLIPAMATRESGNDTRRHQQTTARGASSLFLFLWRSQGPQIKLNWSATRASFPGRIEAIENLENHTCASRTPLGSTCPLREAPRVHLTPAREYRQLSPRHWQGIGPARPPAADRSCQPQSACLSSRFHRRQSHLDIPTIRRRQTAPPRAPELTKSSRVQQSS